MNTTQIKERITELKKKFTDANILNFLDDIEKEIENDHELNDIVQKLFNQRILRPDCYRQINF